DACPLLDELKTPPRKNAEAEQLGFEAAGTLTAPADVYARIDDDLTRIRALRPTLANIHARPTWPSTRLELHFDKVGIAAIDDGTYAAWDCLNTRYGLSDRRVESSYGVDLVILQFGARSLNMSIVENAYASLPNQNGKPHGDGLIGDDSDVCASIAGQTYSYVFKKGEGDCPAGCTEITYSGFTTEPDGTVAVLGTHGPAGGPLPAWLANLSACRKWFGFM
ncbi:MAG: hypothetical protein JWP87_319, partial [Labilithrix sp.]|nr:hypothetical protein [Labilithrix sp.]